MWQSVSICDWCAIFCTLLLYLCCPVCAHHPNGHVLSMSIHHHAQPTVHTPPTPSQQFVHPLHPANTPYTQPTVHTPLHPANSSYTPYTVNTPYTQPTVHTPLHTVNSSYTPYTQSTPLHPANSSYTPTPLITLIMSNLCHHSLSSTHRHANNQSAVVYVKPAISNMFTTLILSLSCTPHIDISIIHIHTILNGYWLFWRNIYYYVSQTHRHVTHLWSLFSYSYSYFTNTLHE